MRVKAIGLLLASLSSANAGIFQRQCDPSTVTVTATAIPATANGPVPPGYETSAITLTTAPLYTPPGSLSDFTSIIVSTVTVTETETVVLPTILTASTFTNVVTVPYTSTVTQTVTGLSSSSLTAIPSSLELSTQSEIKHVASTPDFSSSKSTTNPVKSVVVVLSTATVVPIPMSVTQNDQNAHTAPSETAVESVLPTSVTLPSTSTVFLTTTIATSSFPTLTVSGSMGVTPSGFSGPATAGSSAFGTAGTGASAATGSPAASVSAPISPVAPFANSSTTDTQGILTSSSGIPSSTGALRRRSDAHAKREFREKRQVGAIVTATIDGVVVTWTNTWNGGVPLTTSSAGLPTTSVATSTSGLVTPVLVTATIDGVVVSWTQSFAPAMTTSTPTVTTQAIVLGGPVAVGSSTTATSLSSGPAAQVSTSTAIFAGTSVSVLPLTSSESIYTPSGVMPYHVPSWLASEFPYPPSETNIVTTSSLGTSTVISISTTSSPIATGSTSTSSVTTLATTASFLNSTSTASASSPASTCTGRFSGAFTIDFDDLPRNGEPASSNQYPPFQNPYNDLYWSQGFSYAPPPSDPYPPHSGTQLGVFVVDGNANVHSQNWTGPIPNNTDVNGMFGAGPNSGNPAFSIDAYSAYIGCQYSGPGECQIQVNGYAIDAVTGDTALQVEQYFYQAPCASNCELQQFTFSPAFHNLSALQVQASVQGDDADTSLTWYIDDISLAWSDNSCDAVQSRDQASGPGRFGRFAKRWNQDTKRESIVWQDRVPMAPPKQS